MCCHLMKVTLKTENKYWELKMLHNFEYFLSQHAFFKIQDHIGCYSAQDNLIFFVLLILSNKIICHRECGENYSHLFTRNSISK